ncbi:MAG: hypothetical protein NC489_11450 [Ruminococcus flavefaciens]|nr:hypothetical protein [Ruminococcus flavefaciens]
MGLVGNRIVQSRVWLDPKVKPEPNLNFEYTFPITVFDAVREDMLDPESITLTEVLERIRVAFENRQMLIPGLPANNLVTYAGVPGSVGSIQISQTIPWDPSKQRHDRIPTEKAVGEYMYKLGLIDHNGNIIDPEQRRYVWTDIIGRPNVYEDLGDNDDGFMTQRAVTEHINALKEEMKSLSGVTGDRFEDLINRVSTHIEDQDNPHNVTPGQIGAVQKEVFDAHLNADNPHGITPEMIGLGNVDNTSDEEKPISNATQAALDDLEKLIKSIQEDAMGGIDISGLRYFSNAKYDQDTGNLQLFYNNGTHINVYIPTNELVADIRYDEETKRIVFTRLSGSKRYLDLANLSDLVIKYNGSENATINITVDDIEGSEDKIIRATVNPKSITREMLSDDAITPDLIPDKSITGDKLFRGGRDHTILATMEAGENPRWSRVISAMLEDKLILEQHIDDQAVTTAKIKDLGITTEKLKDLSVTEEKIADGAVTNDKVADGSISGSKLAWNPEFIGTPSITVRPNEDDSSSRVPDTQWVRTLIDRTIIDRNHISDEAVGPSKLFRPTTHNNVLINLHPHTLPEWGKINHEMLESDVVDTDNVKNLTITHEKLADESILSRHLTKNLVSEYNLQEGSVTSDKIWTTHSPNMILGVHNPDEHPFYTKVNQEMMEQNSIGTLQIQDRSVTLSKLESVNASNRVLTVGVWNSEPKWSQINSKMIEDRAIQPNHLFTSKETNVVLGITDPDSDPVWMKLNGSVLEDSSIGENHIKDNSITEKKIAPDSINSDQIKENSILSKHLTDRAVEAKHLFTSDRTDMVLGVKEAGGDPVWSKITTDMIEDLSITPAKMYRSEQPYRVLGVRDPNVPPEYLRITGEFFEDGSITSSKLGEDIVLRGNPHLANHPSYGSNSYAIATTAWVRRLLQDSVDGIKGEIPENALLPGSPKIEVRPPANASDDEYNGNLIPDCQWVMDRIKEFYDKIIEMSPDIPEDIWGELIPEGKPGGAAWCGTCVLEEMEGIYVENTWDNNGADPDHEEPEDPWDAHCMMEQITAEIVQRIWDTDKISTDFDVDINWPNVSKLGSDGLLKIEVPDDYEGPKFSMLGGKLRATGSDDVVDRLELRDGKLVFIGTDELFNQVDLSNDIIDNEEESIIEKLKIDDDQLFMEERSSSTDRYPFFKVDPPVGNLLVELPNLYTGPSFSMKNGYLFAEGEESEIKKYDIIDSKVVVDVSYDKQECHCDIEEVTEDWVHEVWDDELTNGGGSGSGSCNGNCSGSVANGSITAIKIAMGAVTTAKLADRAVTGAKLFSSTEDDMVLGVKEAGGDPVYLKITRAMLDHSRIIDGSRLFSSYTPNQILAVVDSGSDPQWTKIRGEFIDDNTIENRHIVDESITGRKIKDRSIGANKLADEAMIYPVHLTDKSITEDKIDLEAVGTKHIKDGAITGDKIAKDIVIPAYPTVEAHTDYERRSLRNTILSPNPPKGGQNGDIWFRYV